MLKELLLERIKSIVAEHFDVSFSEVNDSTNLKELGDDLDFEELLMSIEEEFEFEINENLEELIHTPKDIANVVLAGADTDYLVEMFK